VYHLCVNICVFCGADTHHIYTSLDALPLPLYQAEGGEQLEGPGWSEVVPSPAEPAVRILPRTQFASVTAADQSQLLSIPCQCNKGRPIDEVSIV